MTEAHKPAMLARGQWRPTAKGNGRTAGFHLPQFYSTFEPLANIAQAWRDIKRLKYSSREKLKAFVNTVLGETWEEPEALTTTEDVLAARREKYVACPLGVVLIVASVDVQGNRLECLVKGWGMDMESWLIDLRRFYYATPSGKEAWSLLDDYLRTEFPLMNAEEQETGVRLPILRTFVDSGYRATDVYAWTGPRRHRGVYAIKGRPGEREPLIGKISRTQTVRGGAILVPIGTHEGKRTIYSHLDISERGSGYMHMNALADSEYLKQLTAEKLIPKYTREGIPHMVWMRKVEGGRNEALDLEVYNLAAFRFLNANMNVLREKLDAQVEAARHAPGSAPLPGSAGRTPTKPTTTARPVYPRRSWVKGWR